MKITVLIGIATSVAAVVIAAGCGSSANGSAHSSGSYSAAAVASAHRRHGATRVGVASSQLGRILVDSKGHTLYLFEKDKNRRSACYGTVRDVLAAAPHPRKARRSCRREAVASRHDPTLERQPAGHLQRPSPIPVRARPEAGPDQRRGPAGLRRRLGCRLTSPARRSSPMADRASCVATGERRARRLANWLSGGAARTRCSSSGTPKATGWSLPSATWQPGPTVRSTSRRAMRSMPSTTPSPTRSNANSLTE